LHGGDARGDHLEGRIERVEIEIDPPRHEPCHEPQLERHVRRAELHWGQPDMVVGVDQARQHRTSAQIASDSSPRITMIVIRTIINNLAQNALLCWPANGWIQSLGPAEQAPCQRDPPNNETNSIPLAAPCWRFRTSLNSPVRIR